MSIKISPELRKLYAEKVLELANIGAGATLFSQFLTDKGFSVTVQELSKKMSLRA